MTLEEPDDFWGIIYVALFLGLRDSYGIHLPGGNRLQSKRDRFCVEFAAEICLGEAGSMMTPGQFKFSLLSKGLETMPIADNDLGRLSKAIRLAELKRISSATGWGLGNSAA